MELTSTDWEAYYQATIDRPLHPLFTELEKHLPPPGDATDLGCGVGHGTRFLIDKGFRVTAIDAEERSVQIVRERIPQGCAELHVGRFEEFEPPPSDLTIAFFSLFFLPREKFDAFWAKVAGALRPGGVFAGQFLGVRDNWAERGYTVHAADDVRRLLEAFDVLYFEEAERDGETAMGTPKHWHVFHVVARKR